MKTIIVFPTGQPVQERKEMAENILRELGAIEIVDSRLFLGKSSVELNILQDRGYSIVRELSNAEITDQDLFDLFISDRLEVKYLKNLS